MANELVFISNNQVVVSSRDVAEKFGKRHDHVLRDIDDILRGLPKIGDTPLFYENTYIHPQNGQQYPEYLMNRDGFTLLAMGFTGKEALQWKMKYIAAFNEMEAELKNPQQTPLQKQEAEIKLNNSRARLNNSEARLNDSRRRMADFILKCADKTKSEAYKEICNKNAIDVLNGKEVMPMLPVMEPKTLTAKEVGAQLGISENMVGRLTNKNGLKNETYGKWYHATAKHNDKKEVDTFRYYPSVIPVLKRMLTGETAASPAAETTEAMLDGKEEKYDA